MMNTKKYLLFLLVSFMFFSYSFSQNWELKLEKNGVTVYTRPFAGSNVREFRGEITVKSNMGSILALIDSVSEYPKWMYNVTYASRPKKISRDIGYTYTIIKSTWPVSDRDICTYYTVKQDTATKIVTIALTGIKDYMPLKDGTIRVPAITGFWQLIPMAKGVTKVIYQVHCESGGYVPASIVNAYITDTPYYNLFNLRNIVESPLYPKKVIPNVKEM